MKIGELSRLLELPVTTIRFYENEGILSPERGENGKYRNYSSTDILNLLECIRYRNMGFSVKDTAASLHQEPIAFLEQLYKQEIETQQRNMLRQERILDCLRSQKRRIDTIPYNVGNYWVDRLSALIVLDVAVCTDVGYGDILCKPCILSKWAQHFPFVMGIDVTETSKLQNEEPERAEVFTLAVQNTSDHEELKETASRIIPETLCLNTIFDSESSGVIPLKTYCEFYRYAQSHYRVKGDVLAEFVVRCGDERHPHRYWQIRVPVEI